MRYVCVTLQKRVYSNVLKILQPKQENFQIKIRRGGSNEYQNLCFLAKNKKNEVYSCKPQFSYIKLYKRVFVMEAIRRGASNAYYIFVEE